MLDADRQAHQIRGTGRCRAFDARAMLGEAFHRAERSGALEHAKPRGERACRRFAVTQAQRQHAAVARGHLPRRGLVSRVVRKSRIQHVRQPRMTVETGRDRHGVVARGGDAQVQRAHPPREERRFDRSEHGAAGAADVADALPQVVVGRGREHAGDHVGMAVEVLRRGMHDDVRAECQRPRQQRSRDGRIDRDDRAGLARDRARRRDVGDVPRGIGRRLDPDQARAPCASLGREIVERRVVVEIEPEPPRSSEVDEPLAQSPVHVAGDEHVVAVLQGLEYGGRRGLPRGEEQRRRGALERRDQRFGPVVGRIVRAGIDTPAGIAAVRAALVRRRDVDRRHDVEIGRRHAAEALRNARRAVQLVGVVHGDR